MVQACQESTLEGHAEQSASEATTHLYKKRKLQTALTTLALYLAPLGTPRENLLHFAESLLHDLRAEEVDILAKPDRLSKYCGTCNIRMYVAAWQVCSSYQEWLVQAVQRHAHEVCALEDLKTRQRQCILCHDHEADVKRFTLLTPFECELLDNLLQQAVSGDLLPVPCTEHQVSSMCGDFLVTYR